MKRSDLTGKIFDHLKVLYLAPPHRTISGESQVMWWCECDCGHIRQVKAGHLRTKNTKSCGCIKNGKPHRCECILDKSGYTVCDLPEYIIWMRMRERCHNPKDPGYKDYGGRGIAIHPSWDSFDQFLSDVGHRESKEYSLDRIDNNGNYEKENVKWSTRTEQARNTRRNHWITLNNETKILEDWARSLGTTSARILTRMNRDGWSIERALTEPVQHHTRYAQLRSFCLGSGRA